ncbi:MAG: hypothetical protein IT303_17900 [Dehalococcoidia bacterium]|nr:hypothetical protein [Dehalococcoidia bacterium]
MATYRRRYGAFSLLILVIVAISGGATLSRVPFAVAQAAGEEFTQVLPATLYVGDPSHPGDADADPTLGTNGYCIDIAGSAVASLGGSDGFAITNGVILDTDYFDNGSPGDSSDDVYCAVVAGTIPNDDLPRVPITLRWTYSDGGSDPVTIELLITQVKVTFTGTDGAVGGVATVCTRGWDPTFLTGEASNTPPTVPNVVDVVDVTDWTILTAGVTPVGAPYKQGPEWCLNMTSGAPVSGIDVELAFYAVYDQNTELDDILHTETATDIAEFFSAAAPELRHVDTAGNIVQPQIANPNVVTAPHTACVVPSIPGDQLTPGNIQFTSSDGATGNVISVFHDADGTNGVPDGTLCFTWTSSSPGRQFITATVTLAPGGPTLAAGSTIGVSWDTDGDRNGTEQSGPLVKDWFLIDRTEITTTGTLNPDSIVTNGSVIIGPQFNAGTGSFLGGITLFEWVIGYRDTPSGRVEAALDGVEVRLRIESDCGYFLPEDDQLPLATKAGPGGPVAIRLGTVTLGGRVPFTVTIDDDLDCVPGDVIRVEIDVFYPGEDEPFPETEFIDIVVAGFTTNSAAPQLLWVGQTATIVYGFAGSGCGDLRAVFTKSAEQPGAFTSGSISGPNSAELQFDNDTCSATIGFESEKPGEVDIVASFIDTDPQNGTTPGDFSKVHFPLFFLEFEDVTLSIDADDHNVSEYGTLEANVRGWFPGTNFSARPAETKPDGRTVPAHRWVLPDDWQLLKGPDDFRFSWPNSAPMPPSRVTFFMENESTVNSFRGGVKNGGSGFFVPDDDLRSFDFNIHPESRQPSALGAVSRPRIISEHSDTDGLADIDIFGDFNLSFEGCEPNTFTGNPYCDPGDIAGSTRYFVVADYTEWRGKHPQVASNVVSTTWTWAGYKRLSVVDTPDPAIKYLVAHLKDRDGYCDAISFNNTLGNVINFEFDAGRNGIILAAADRPFSIRLDKEQATATTFDIQDDLGNPINVEITQPPIDADECQAWIKISNTLQTPIDVLVTFPAPPVPLPGQLRITRLVCGPSGFATLTNTGTTPISLAGFGLRSALNLASLTEEHLGLQGYLEPGQSIDVSGSPGLGPWINVTGEYAFGNAANDYARIVWNEFQVHMRRCDGTEVTTEPPNPLPLDPEGEIKLDIVIPFGQQTGAPLTRGWNLVTVPTGAPISQVLGTDTSKVEGIYQFDQLTGTWRRYISGAPAYVQTLERFDSGGVYWVQVNEAFTLRLTR